MLVITRWYIPKFTKRFNFFWGLSPSVWPNGATSHGSIHHILLSYLTLWFDDHLRTLTKTFHRRWATESLTRLKPLATVSRSPQISPKFRTREYKTEFQSHFSPTITIFHQWSQFFPHGPVTSSSCRPWTPVFITRSLPAKSTRYSWAKRCFPGSTWKNIGNTWMLLGEMWRKCWVNLCCIYKIWFEEWHSKSGRCRQCRRLNSGNTSSIAQRLWTLDGAEGSVSVTVYLDQYDHWASPVHIALWPLVASRGNRSVR